jgi:LysR family transcriptional regulator, glycine cleavage system transcriptional activator
MADRLPSLNALRAFEAVARHGNFRQAAAELHVTTAAVSQQVKGLEQDLGLRLLQRGNGGWQLTTAGQAGVSELRLGFDHLWQGVRKMRRAGRQRLTVSVVPSFAALWLVPRLDRFRATHPDLDLLIDATRAAADFDRGDADVAVRYGTGNLPGLHSVRLFEDEVFPVCSPRLLQGAEPLREPGDLRHHTLLHLEWAPVRGEWPDWRVWLQAAGVTDIDADRGPRFMPQSMVLQAAIDGQGVALGTMPLAIDHLAAGRLVRPFELSLPTLFGYYVVTPPETAQQPAIAAFREWLIAEARRSLEPTSDP